jgi:hypothetical protein
MPTSNISVLYVGMPGPSGAGVSAAEKASFVTLTAANAFTAAQTITKTAAPAFLVENDGGTDLFRVNTTDSDVEIYGGGLLEGYSDAGTTQTWSVDSSTGAAQFDSTVTTTRVVGDTSVWSVIIDGGGSTITTGVKFDLEVPYNATVTAWDIFGDTTGSIVVDIWQDTYANFPPTVADVITTSEKPTISASNKGQDTSLNSGNGWSVTQGRILRFNVDSVSTVTRVTIALKVTRV